MIESCLLEFRRYKSLAESALGQVEDQALFSTTDPTGNGIAVIVRHLSGNLRSRFTDFLTSDGEKTWRDRDGEFATTTISRGELLKGWESSWSVLFNAVAALSEADLSRTVQIRSQTLTVVAALQRSLSHIAYHVGQIVLLARSAVGEEWTPLSIPPGQSRQYNEYPTLETGLAQLDVQRGGEAEYETDQPETLAEVPGLRVRLLTLGPGQSVPWHLHTEITDTFFCMDGPMRVKTRDPDAAHILAAGETLGVEPGTPHEVTPAREGGACRFMIVQGVGTYDYVPLELPE